MQLKIYIFPKRVLIRYIAAAFEKLLYQKGKPLGETAFTWLGPIPGKNCTDQSNSMKGCFFMSFLRYGFDIYIMFLKYVLNLLLKMIHITHKQYQLPD